MSMIIQHDFEGRIWDVKPRTDPVVFVAEASFDELCDPGCPTQRCSIADKSADLSGHGKT